MRSSHSPLQQYHQQHYKKITVKRPPFPQPKTKHTRWHIPHASTRSSPTRRICLATTNTRPRLRAQTPPSSQSNGGIWCTESGRQQRRSLRHPGDGIRITHWTCCGCAQTIASAPQEQTEHAPCNSPLANLSLPASGFLDASKITTSSRGVVQTEEREVLCSSSA